MLGLPGEEQLMSEDSAPVTATSRLTIVYFANDWASENRTSSHHIAERLSRWQPLLYVESPGMRTPQARRARS